MSGIPFPPKPWVDGQTFEYEQDGTTVTGKYNASSNAWTFTRSYPGASTGQITTATVLAMNERPPALAVSPFSDAYQGTETQQDLNWFLYDDITATIRYSDDEPSSDNFVNRFWWDSNTEVLYVWDGGQWQLSSPNAASQNVTRGITIDASGGAVNETGNLRIKEDADTAGSGRLLIENDAGTNTFKMYPTGSFETYGSISFTGSSTNKNIRAWGVANPTIKFQLGPDAQNLFELMTIDTNFVNVTGAGGLIVDNPTKLKGAAILESTLDVTGDSSLADLSVTGNISSSGTLTVGGLTSITNDLDVGGNIVLSESLKLGSSNPIEFNLAATQTITLAENNKVKVQPTIYGGGAQGDPTNGYFEIGVRDTSQAYVTFPYKIDLATGYETNIEAPKVTRMYLNNGGFYFYKGSGGTSPASNILAIFNRNNTAMEAWAPIRASNYAGDQPGITISAEHNTTSLWNQPKAGVLSFQTWTNAGNANGGTTGVTVGPNHTSPSFTLSFTPKDVTPYLVFSNTYTPTYGKRMYIYPDYDNPNVPDQTPVTIGYLKEHSIVGQATYTSSQGAPDSETQDQNYIITQSSVSVPAQLELEGRTDTGRGFTLLGKSVDQPTNSSAMLLSAYHTSQDGSAEIDYFGTTSGDANIQTGESVDSRIQSATNALSVLPTTWDFYNSVSSGTASQLTGSWVLQWAYNADSVIMIVSAVNSSDTDITTGTVISSIPSGIAPNKSLAIPLTSRDGMTTALAIVSPTTGFITVRNVQGPGDHRLEGQLIYSLHA